MGFTVVPVETGTQPFTRHARIGVTKRQLVGGWGDLVWNQVSEKYLKHVVYVYAFSL
jgi:hypothetical protein